MFTDDSTGRLYRRQFIISGGRKPALGQHWVRIPLRDGLQVTAHPDLMCHSSLSGSTETVLLGFTTDPLHPERGTEEILQRLTESIEGGDDAIGSVAGLGGRWVLVVARSTDMCAIGDPGALRQLFYTDTSHDELVCASQPGLIAEHLGLSTSREAMEDFVAHEVGPDREFWWPGDSSPLRGVRRLLPNHSLDLDQRTARRFWPTGPLPRVTKARAVPAAAELLMGQVSSAANQFELAQSITAGLDSRTVLAASRGSAPDIYYYTLRFDGVDPRDIDVPSELLPDLGLLHHVIPTPAHMSDAFSEQYHRNVLWAHDRWGAMVEGMVHSYPTQRVAMDGTVSEVTRCGYYGTDWHPKNTTAADLAEMTEMEPTEFVLREFRQWLAEAEPVAAMSGIPLLDLFYWEQRVGNWASAALVELDLVQETFTPFNHRELLALLLGVDRRLRALPRDRLHRSLIKHMWPEVLSTPTNPVPVALRLRYRVLSALQALRLAGPVRGLIRWIRSGTSSS